MIRSTLSLPFSILNNTSSLRVMLHTLHQLHCSYLDMFQHFTVLGHPGKMHLGSSLASLVLLPSPFKPNLKPSQWALANMGLEHFFHFLSALLLIMFIALGVLHCIMSSFFSPFLFCMRTFVTSYVLTTCTLRGFFDFLLPTCPASTRTFPCQSFSCSYV